MTDFEQAKNALEQGTEQAKEILTDPQKFDQFLIDIENKLKEVPFGGDLLSKIPLMTAMIKSYVTKEYTVVSPKVIGLLASAFVYLLKSKDLIPDKMPLVGHIDDAAVFAAALKLSEPELNAFAAWREENKA